MKILNTILAFLIGLGCLTAQDIPEIELCDSPRKTTLSVANYNSNYEYYWASPDNLFQPTSGSEVQLDIYQPGTYTISLITQNLGGNCSVKTVYMFTVTSCKNWAYYASNAVVPDGYYNTRWYPKTWNVTILELTIWNRWGELVYDKLEPWDPTYVQDGVYTARVTYLRPPGIEEIIFHRVTVVK